jgi:hypothetical protein
MCTVGQAIALITSIGLSVEKLLYRYCHVAHSIRRIDNHLELFAQAFRIKINKLII